MVKDSILKRFYERGGYGEVTRSGNTWRGIAEAHRKTGISEFTIRNILKEFTSPPKELQGERIWATPQQSEELEKALSQLKMVCKRLEVFREYFERSLIVDLKELRSRQELQGETIEQFQEALRKQVKADEKEKSDMERLFIDTLNDFNFALDSLFKTANSMRAFH